MLTIITPSCRQNYLEKLFNSIQFDKIDKWIIVYDTSKNRTYNKIFNNPKIIETFCDVVGQAGHPQRNFGVNLVQNGHIYFLDDDNIIHPNFWNIIDSFEEEYFYTFNQIRNKRGDLLFGNKVEIGKIDTAMFVVPKKMFEGIKWDITRYEADGIFITTVNNFYSKKHKYINCIACYYNYLVN